MSKNWKTVSKEEFDAYISNYSKPLVLDIAQFFEPPLATYNDFSDGKVWPESVVAQVVLNSRCFSSEVDTYQLPVEKMDNKSDDKKELLPQTKPAPVLLTDADIDTAWRSVDYTASYEVFRMSIGRAIESAVLRKNGLSE